MMAGKFIDRMQKNYVLIFPQLFFSFYSFQKFTGICGRAWLFLNWSKMVFIPILGFGDSFELR
jgi:hypothetical protein